MRNPTPFLLSCLIFAFLFNLLQVALSQSNTSIRSVFMVTEGPKLFTKTSDIIHFKPSDYTGSPWNFDMNDLYDSNAYFRKSASFWVRHNFTSAPSSEVRLVRAASTFSSTPEIATDAHFMVKLQYVSGNIQLVLTYIINGTPTIAQTITGGINLKPYTWYGVFVSRSVLASGDQGALFIYDPSTITSGNYVYDLQASAAISPPGYTRNWATSSFYIDIGGDTLINNGASLCEIANFNFLYKIDFYNTASAILELIKQPPRLLLWLEYRETDDTVQLVEDYSSQSNIVFRGDSQFDTNKDTTLNYDVTSNNDVGHVYSQNGFDTIFPAFDLGREFAISFWIQLSAKPSAATSDTTQIVFFKQNTQYPNMRVKIGFQSASVGAAPNALILQCGNTVKTETISGVNRGDGTWYYFYVYMANFNKNETTTATFHPTTLYNIRYSRYDGSMATTITGIVDDYFIHGGTNDIMRIGMGVDGNNENLYAVIKKFQIYSGGWNFDVSSDPSTIVLGGANTIHITDGVLSTKVFSLRCNPQYTLSDNDCRASCPLGAYQVTVDTNYLHCETCYPNCQTCTGRKGTQCQSCFYGNYDPFGVLNCPGKLPCSIHQYDTGTMCLECMVACASCKDSTSCSACAGGYAYNQATNQCDVAICGDGVVNAGEDCDDGNYLNRDGCSTSCAIEQGFYCPPFGGSCYSKCGDNILASDEQCDDGNNNNGDGCNYACQMEDGYLCTPVTGTNIGPFYGASYKETCAACANGSFLFGTSCITSCPIGYCANSATHTCKVCPILSTEIFSVTQEETNFDPDTQELPMAVSLPDGGFFIVWRGCATSTTSSSNCRIYGKVYNSDRTNRTSAFIISAPLTSQGNPMPALFQNGSILIVWNDYKLYGSVYNPDGTNITNVFVIATIFDFGFTITLTPLKDGRFLLVYANSIYLSDSTGINFNLKSYAGASNSIKPYPSTTFHSAVALDSGGFAVFYTDSTTFYGEFYDSTGTIIGTRFQAGTNAGGSGTAGPQVVMLTDGNLALVWESAYSSSTVGIYGRILSPDNSYNTSEFKIADGNDAVNPWILMVPHGGFLVSWLHISAGNYSLLGQQYNADYTANGSQIVLGQYSVAVGFSLTALQSGSYLALGKSLYNSPASGIAAWTFSLPPVWPSTISPPETNSNDTHHNSNNNIGLIIGVVIACVVIIILCYIGIRVIQNRRNAKQHILSNNPDQPSQEKQLDMKASSTENLEGKKPEEPVQPVEPGDIQIVMEQLIGILPNNNPILPNFVPAAREVEPLSDNLDFAPQLNAQDIKNYLMDGRLAKPLMNNSHQFNREASNSSGSGANNQDEDAMLINGPDSQAVDNLSYGIQLDPSTVRAFVLDGRLAKPAMNPPQQDLQLRDPAHGSRVGARINDDIADQIELQVYQGEIEQSIPPQEESVEGLDNYYDFKEKKPFEEGKENPGEDEAKGSALCIVCHNEPSVMVFLDCMHICTCQGCSVAVASSTNQCPICREIIKDIRKVYVV